MSSPRNQFLCSFKSSFKSSSFSFTQFIQLKQKSANEKDSQIEKIINKERHRSINNIFTSSSSSSSLAPESFNNSVTLSARRSTIAKGPQQSQSSAGQDLKIQNKNSSQCYPSLKCGICFNLDFLPKNYEHKVDKETITDLFEGFNFQVINMRQTDLKDIKSKMMHKLKYSKKYDSIVVLMWISSDFDYVKDQLISEMISFPTTKSKPKLFFIFNYPSRNLNSNLGIALDTGFSSAKSSADQLGYSDFMIFQTFASSRTTLVMQSVFRIYYPNHHLMELLTLFEAQTAPQSPYENPWDRGLSYVQSNLSKKFYFTDSTSWAGSDPPRLQDHGACFPPILPNVYSNSTTDREREFHQLTTEKVRTGKCFIIDIQDIDKDLVPYVKQADIDKLAETFVNLNFDVTMYRGNNQNKTMDILLNLSSQDFSGKSCIVLCVFGHVDRNLSVRFQYGFIGNDTIIHSLCSNLSLFNKPKLIFMQTSLKNSTQESLFSDSFTNQLECPSTIMPDLLVLRCFVCKSSAIENSSLRFVSILSKIFYKYSDRLDIINMLIRVMAKLKNAKAEFSTNWEIPLMMSTLTRSIMFTKC